MSNWKKDRWPENRYPATGMRHRILAVHPSRLFDSAKWAGEGPLVGFWVGSESCGYKAVVGVTQQWAGSDPVGIRVRSEKEVLTGAEPLLEILVGKSISWVRLRLTAKVSATRPSWSVLEKHWSQFWLWTSKSPRTEILAVGCCSERESVVV